MQLVGTVYYDGRREDPHSHRTSIERLLSAVLRFHGDAFDMKATPAIELDWGLLPLNGSFVLQLKDCRLWAEEVHPFMRGSAPVYRFIDSYVENLRDEVSCLDRDRDETGYVVPVLILSTDYTSSMSQIRVEPMTILSSDAQRYIEQVEQVFPAPEQPTPEWYAGLRE